MKNSQSRKSPALLLRNSEIRIMSFQIGISNTYNNTRVPLEDLERLRKEVELEMKRGTSFSKEIFENISWISFIVIDRL